jgi:hypothetical protein
LWSGNRHSFCDKLSRRQFLKAGALGVANLTLADVLRLRAENPAAAESSPKAVIMISLLGGPPHIDMYDLKPDAPDGYRGEFRPTRTNVPGFDICELMVHQAKIADKLAVVRNLQMSTGDHNEDQELLSGVLYEVGTPNGAKRIAPPRPAFGSVVSRLQTTPKDVPPYVSMRGNHSGREIAAYLGPAHRPFQPPFRYGPGGRLAVEDLPLTLGKKMTLERLADRTALHQAFDTLRRDIDTKGEMAGMDQFNARALDMITSPKAREAFDIAREPDRVQEKYGAARSFFPAGKFLIARRLVEAGVSVVTLDALGWDTHENNFPHCREAIPVVDRALAALVSDLAERGLDKDVAIVMWGEFGRTPKIATQQRRVPGRDHYAAANFVLFAGGGLKMGQVIGATDAKAEKPKGVPYRPQHVLATLYHVLGIDPATTLPDHVNRPMPLLDDPKPIAELVG